MEGYSSDSSDCSDPSFTLDLSHLSMLVSGLQQRLEQFCVEHQTRTEHVETMLLYSNHLLSLPPTMLQFQALKVIDLSSNSFIRVPYVLTQCTALTTLIIKNNQLDADSFPKSLGQLSTSLKELNLSGNRLDTVPEQLFELKNLKYLYLGSNRIQDIPRDIKKLASLQVLYLGGNQIKEVPVTVGQLTALTALVLCDNHLEILPSAIANLKNLRSLLLHRNRLKTLPQEIVALRGLTELSLRDNPLVVRFVRDMTHQPPASLLELAARVVQIYTIPYGPEDLPKNLAVYLASAHHCVNPLCKGVFFDNRVEHIKFVDFCGKYRVPLLQYLCSERCISNIGCEHGEDDEEPIPGNEYLLRKVLLG